MRVVIFLSHVSPPVTQYFAVCCLQDPAAAAALEQQMSGHQSLRSLGSADAAALGQQPIAANSPRRLFSHSMPLAHPSSPLPSHVATAQSSPGRYLRVKGYHSPSVLTQGNSSPGRRPIGYISQGMVRYDRRLINVLPAPPLGQYT